MNLLFKIKIIYKSFKKCIINKNNIFYENELDLNYK